MLMQSLERGGWTVGKRALEYTGWVATGERGPDFEKCLRPWFARTFNTRRIEIMQIVTKMLSTSFLTAALIRHSYGNAKWNHSIVIPSLSIIVYSLMKRISANTRPKLISAVGRTSSQASCRRLRCEIWRIRQITLPKLLCVFSECVDCNKGNEKKPTHTQFFWSYSCINASVHTNGIFSNETKRNAGRTETKLAHNVDKNGVRVH